MTGIGWVTIPRYNSSVQYVPLNIRLSSPETIYMVLR